MDSRPGIRPRMDDRGPKRNWRDSMGDSGRGRGYGGPPPQRFRGRGGGRGGDLGPSHDGGHMDRDSFFKEEPFGRGGPVDRGMTDRNMSDRGGLQDRKMPDRGGPPDRNIPDRGGPPDRNIPDRGLLDRGMPDRGMPDRGMPDRGIPDRGMPDRGMPDRGMPDRGMPDRPAPDRGLPPRDFNNDRFRNDGPPQDYPQGPSIMPPLIGQDRTNDVEIIVVNRALTEYSEFVESQLKNLGMSVDLLFPNEDVPLGRVLANISSRGTLYACLVHHANAEHRSLTVNILHGQPQEHRNMPLEEALKLITRDFDSYRLQNEKGPGGVPLLELTPATNQHPEPIQMLLNALAANRQITVLQFDKIIAYLREKREVQLKLELGDTKGLPIAPVSDASVASNPQQAELQHRILNILNQSGGGGGAAANNRPAFNGPPQKPPVPSPQNKPVGGPTPVSNPGQPAPLLNDPNVQKAIDNLLQGDLMKKITPNSNPTPQPLFSAFANSGGPGGNVGPPNRGRGGRF